jgi:hypothetical protein
MSAPFAELKGRGKIWTARSVWWADRKSECDERSTQMSDENRLDEVVAHGLGVEGQSVEGQSVEGQSVEAHDDAGSDDVIGHGQSVEGLSVEGQSVEGQSVE